MITQEDGRVSFDLRSYISVQDMRELFQDACSKYLREFFNHDTERKLSNLIYYLAFNIVDEVFKARQEDFRQKMTERIEEAIKGHETFYIFRDGKYGDPKSPAQNVLEEEEIAARPLIRARVEKAIEEYDFGKINEYAVTDELYNVIHDQLFGRK